MTDLVPHALMAIDQRAAPNLRVSRRMHAAREAVALCTGASQLAEQASAAVGIDDDRLFALLEQRETMLADLAEHIVALRLERPTADNPLIASSELVADDADALVTEVCEAIGAAHRTTMALARRVADRATELRTELAGLQRAGQASLGYAALEPGLHVDRVR